MNTSLKKTIALAAATLISSTAVVGTANAGEEKGKCVGANECKGQTACATAEGSCAGTNSCKGKGWLPMSKEECAKTDGKFEAFKK